MKLICESSAVSDVPTAASRSLRLFSVMSLQRERRAAEPKDRLKVHEKPSEVCLILHTAAYLVAEVLRGDAEDVQAHGGLLELGLQDLQLEVLLLAALPELLDQSSVQLLGPVSLVGRAPSHCTTK